MRGPSRTNPALRAGPDVGLVVDRDAPDGVGLVLVSLPAFRETLRRPGRKSIAALRRSWQDTVLAYLAMAPAVETLEDPRERRCGDVYVVRMSWAHPGWGPLLYDMGLAVAEKDGRQGLMADRNAVSLAAEQLWAHYRDRRGDVRARALPEDCPRHGVGPLDATYAPLNGFPREQLATLERQMDAAVARAEDATGASAREVTEALGETAMVTAGRAMIGAPPGGRARLPNPQWLEGRMPNKGKKRKKRKKKGFWDKPRDWSEVLIITPGGDEITRQEIRDYYQDNRDKVFDAIRDQTVMVLFAPSLSTYLYKRYVPGPKGAPKKTIKITKLEGIDDPSSYEYWINRRVLEFHTVIGTKTDYVWVDMDPHARDHDPKLLRAMEAAVPKVEKVIHTVFPKADIKVWWSGKRGIHVEGYLPEPTNTDRARGKLRKELDRAFASDPMFTTGLARPGQIRLDVTTIKRTGSIRSPYSFSVGGLPKRPYEEAAPQGLVARFTAKLKEVFGRAANPTPQMVEAIEGRVDEFRKILRRRMGKEKYAVRAHVVPRGEKVEPFYAVVVEVEVPRKHQCTPALCGAGEGPIDRCEKTIHQAFDQAGLGEYLEFDGTDYGPICAEGADCPTPARGYHFYERRPPTAAQRAANPAVRRLKRRLLR